MNQPIDEAKVRAMRDLVFDSPSTDKNWEACRQNWLRPDSVDWLIEKTNPEILACFSK